MNKAERRAWAAKRINLRDCRSWWIWAGFLDPYGDGDYPLEDDCIGREWFVEDPTDRIPVHISDLPDPDDLNEFWRLVEEAEEPWSRGWDPDDPRSREWERLRRFSRFGFLDDASSG